MKKYFLLMLALFALVLVTSCSKEETDIPEGMKEIENDVVEYRLFYPENWQVDRNDGMVSVFVSDKDSSNLSVTTFAASDDVISVDDYLKMDNTSYFEYMKQTFPSVEMLSSGEEIALDGVPARQFVYTASVAGEEYKFRQIFAYRYGDIFIITFTSTVDGFDKHLDEVNAIIREFKFR